MRKSNYLTHLFRMKEVSRIMLAIMFLFATNFTNRAMAQTNDKSYSFTEDGQLTFIDAQGNVYKFSITEDEISEENIEFIIDGISKLTENGATSVNEALKGVFNSVFGSLNKAITTVEFNINDSSSSEEETSKDEEEDPYKEFVSPQWGLKCPEGYIRMTEYKELAKTDATARLQLDQLTSLMDKYKAMRQKMMKRAYKKITTRHPDVEAKAQKYADRLFERAKIEMMDLGAYRLPDGTIVIEDDKSEQSYVKRPVEWLQGTDTDKGRPLNQAPTLERDKSPNYDAHNEQTWPVYTDVQTVGEEEYKIQGKVPQVIRGKNCTYVVEHYGWLHYHHWFYNDSKSKLVDPKTGAQYMVRYAEHFPMDTYFWVHNVTRKYVRMVSVYPPLPEDVTTVDLIPGIKPAEEQLSNSSPYRVYEGLKVQQGKVVY